MKKCTSCKRIYSDTVMRCPKCGLFLMTDAVSDIGMEDSTKRKTIREVPSEIDERNVVTMSNHNSSSTFKPGRIVTREQNTSQTNHSRVIGSRRGRSIRTDFCRKILSVFRIIIPIIMIILAIFMIMANWSVIQSVLSCLAVGAIIGGVGFTFLSVRFGHLFNPSIVTTGAIVGAIVACFFKYNILNVNVEIGAIVDALAPSVIMLLGIWYLLRSLIR